MTYADGRAKRVSVQMYRGKSIGMSFPNDPNRHNESWQTVFDAYGVKIYCRGGELLALEVDLTDEVNDLHVMSD